MFTADTSLCNVLPEEEQEHCSDHRPWSSSFVCTGELWFPDNTQSPCTVLPCAALAAKICSSEEKQTFSLLCLQSVWICCIQALDTARQLSLMFCAVTSGKMEVFWWAGLWQGHRATLILPPLPIPRRACLVSANPRAGATLPRRPFAFSVVITLCWISGF